MKKITLMILISAASLLILNGCSTIEGAGKDIQGVGKIISKGAKDVKQSSKPRKPAKPSSSY